MLRKRSAAAANRSRCMSATVTPSNAAASATCGVITIAACRAPPRARNRSAIRCSASASTTNGLSALSARSSSAPTPVSAPEPGTDGDDVRPLQQHLDVVQTVERCIDAAHHDLRSARQHRGDVFGPRDDTREPRADPQRRLRRHRDGAAHAAVTADDQARAPTGACTPSPRAAGSTRADRTT